VSTLDELPPGRQPIKTVSVKPQSRARAYKFVLDEVKKGRQAYVVCPLVEESEKLAQLQAATALAERLRHEELHDLRVGLLHGQMNVIERDEEMELFRAGMRDVLVSTTVIEVGVDVPNATVMLIEDADRFGLSQLHQLRGRVGRGQHASTCVLLANPKTEEGRSRISVMTKTQNGFEIAEHDLNLRGPGRVLRHAPERYARLSAGQHHPRCGHYRPGARSRFRTHRRRSSPPMGRTSSTQIGAAPLLGR
jgi:ATP-dependent DNA helicase RecG